MPCEPVNEFCGYRTLNSLSVMLQAFFHIVLMSFFFLHLHVMHFVFILKPEGTMGSLAPGDIGPKAKPQNKGEDSFFFKFLIILL